MTEPTARMEPVLSIRDLEVQHPASRRRSVHAVSGVSFDLHEGETLGLVGESGCGKSSAVRAIFQVPRPTSGRVMLDGRDLTQLRGKALRRARRDMQLVGQDPVSSLNPRRTIGDLVAEPLRIWKPGVEPSGLVDEMLDAVGMVASRVRSRHPYELSGGQCQRVCIARALVLQPRVLICDEPVSALDVSVQAQILNLLEDLKQRFGLSILFIAHDLAVVKRVSDRVAVMYLGKLAEIAPSPALYESPRHPYTLALLSAIPSSVGTTRMKDPAALRGEQPSPLSPPSGCRFRTRCPHASEICQAESPLLAPAPDAADRLVACHHPVD